MVAREERCRSLRCGSQLQKCKMNCIFFLVVYFEIPHFKLTPHQCCNDKHIEGKSNFCHSLKVDSLFYPLTHIISVEALLHFNTNDNIKM